MVNLRIPSLEYSLSHPHPKGRHFLVATLIIFLLTLPLLILVNVATQGSELVPSLQSQYQPNDTLLEGWLGKDRLPDWFRPKAPLCQPKDIGRGDTFRLTNSLFDYTVMSTLNNSHDATGPQVQQQLRAEYKGESFSGCYTNSARFDYNLFDQTQSMMVGVFCPGFPRPDVNVSMQTTVTFAWELSKDFIGQYYGPGLDLLNINETNPSDYRKIVLAILEVISTDAITIMHKKVLPDTPGSMRIVYNVDPNTGIYSDTASTITYANGSQPDQFPEEARVYNPSVENMLGVVLEAVRLDLGSKRFSNIYQNATRFGRFINPNPPPDGFNSTGWSMPSQTFYYGNINTTQYTTWAEALLDGYPVKVGNLTGLQPESVMATTYLCPSYKKKPGNSFLSSIFIGTATMTLSVWGTWMFFTAFVAKKIMAPKVQCDCDGCTKRKKEEAKPDDKLASGPNDEEARYSGSGSGIGSSSKASQLERPTQTLHDKHLSQTSAYTIEEKQNLGAV